MASDVRDILELDAPENEREEYITKEALFGDPKKNKKSKKTEQTFKKPEGMHRELWGLLWTDNKDGPPIMPTDSHQGYKQNKAKIGQSKVRAWRWTPFTNPGRKDGAVFYHWRRVADEGLEYPFARFNKMADVPSYTDLDYQQHLHDDGWTKQETDLLFELCRRFDCRFIIIHDRWDRQKFSARSVEDLKERYYNVSNILAKVRAPVGSEVKIKGFDAAHERRRKEQLEKLFQRTEEQIEEEERLIQELKKIEQRKKEREKKTLDLQKLISAADSSLDARRSERKSSKKTLPVRSRDITTMSHNIKSVLPTLTNLTVLLKLTPDMTSIKFADFKQSGVSLRSQRMKLPASLGQKKTKAIEQILEELGIDLNPVPSKEISTSFNDLRQDIILLHELRVALANCEYELQTLQHRYETFAPNRGPLELNSSMNQNSSGEAENMIVD